MIRSICSVLLVSFAFSFQVFAEGNLSLSRRSSEPITIKSDSLVTDNGRKLATFSGNVAARQGDLTIYSDRFVVVYSEAGNEISTAEVTGNVRIVQGPRRAQADHGVYDAKSSTIVLDGNPKVFQNNDTISGKVITYYLDQDRSEVTSGSGKRVEAVIYPQGKGSDGRSKKP
ncbi:MAG TPA: lipopolysaccharide transport periplasmic protein LptA [Geobacteraceae bacterium]|nr:lipopolysaccharide transport periplasmic protein LptA [Geobacteraceae bacterium]